MRTILVQTGTAAASQEFAADNRARAESRPGFRVGGKLIERRVNVGDTVKPGQVIARIDPRDLRLSQLAADAAVQAGEVNAELAAADYKRFRNLFDQGSISQTELDCRDAALKAARAQAAQALAQSGVQGNQAKGLLRANPSMRGVNDNWNESIKVLRLEVDQDKARALGVTSQALAQASRTLLSGSTIGQYREGDKLVDIAPRQPLDERNAITDLGNAYMPTSSGRSIPITQVARVSFDWKPGVMWREGRNFAVTVQGDVVEGVQGATATSLVWPDMQKLAARMPDGYRIEIAGAVEQGSKGQDSIAAGVPIMLFIIFPLLMLQLQSFSRAMLVVLTGPLGIARVAAALLILNRPFGDSVRSC